MRRAEVYIEDGKYWVMIDEEDIHLERSFNSNEKAFDFLKEEEIIRQTA